MVPFLDLRAQYQSIGYELEAAAIATMRRGTYMLGEPVERFERCFAGYCGTTDAIAVGSGVAALNLALLTAGIGEGDEVITVAATSASTVAAILATGARAVFVDIDPLTWTMDPALIEPAITRRTKAILPVHLHGRLADMASICEIANRRGLLVIEDARHAHGAERDGTVAGAFGHIGCFSFHPEENLGGCGEGGALVTSDPAFARTARFLRQEGGTGGGHSGLSSCMDSIQAACLTVKLPRLDNWNRQRRRLARYYNELLPDDLARPAATGELDHVWHVYAVRTCERDRLRAALHRARIGTDVHYAFPVHRLPAFEGLGYGGGSLPVSERLAAETLSLPLYPEMPMTSVTRVAEAIAANRPSTLRMIA